MPKKGQFEGEWTCVLYWRLLQSSVVLSRRSDFLFILEGTDSVWRNFPGPLLRIPLWILLKRQNELFGLWLVMTRLLDRPWVLKAFRLVKSNHSVTMAELLSITALLNTQGVPELTSQPTSSQWHLQGSRKVKCSFFYSPSRPIYNQDGKYHSLSQEAHFSFLTGYPYTWLVSTSTQELSNPGGQSGDEAESTFAPRWSWEAKAIRFTCSPHWHLFSVVSETLCIPDSFSAA